MSTWMPQKHITGKGATQKKGRGKNTTEHQLSKLSWLNETKWERCNSVKERERDLPWYQNEMDPFQNWQIPCCHDKDIIPVRT